MFGWGEDEHKQVYGGEKHESHFTHELVAGAASFEAAKLFEDHQRKNGKPVSHSFAKEAIAGLVGAEVDKLFESKGLDFLDKEKAKHQAVEQAHQNYDQHYGGQQEWHPDQKPPFDYNQHNYGR